VEGLIDLEADQWWLYIAIILDVGCDAMLFLHGTAFARCLG
jgi:hypothetical protein